MVGIPPPNKKPTCILPPIPNYLSTYQLNQLYHSLFGEYDGARGVEKRKKEGLKMGGKEEKRGACRGESLIICLPIALFFTTHLLMSGGRVEMVRVEEDRRKKG